MGYPLDWLSKYGTAMNRLYTDPGTSPGELEGIVPAVAALGGSFPPAEGFCDVNWGSHGCMHPRGHDVSIPHECPCCECGEHHPYPRWPDTGVLCVAKPPYYGPETRFYGDDVAALGLPHVNA
jgi:hypothetical protein